MMKKFLLILSVITYLFSLQIKNVVANEEVPVVDTDVSYIKVVNGRRCIDMEAAYAEVNDVGKAITQQDNSLESNKRANFVSNLTTIISVLGGNSMFCFKDAETVSKIKDLDGTGIFGYIHQANFFLMNNYPDFNVANHLAKTFIPGNQQNQLIAQERCESMDNFCKQACSVVDNSQVCLNQCQQNCYGSLQTGESFLVLYNRSLNDNGEVEGAMDVIKSLGKGIVDFGKGVLETAEGVVTMPAAVVSFFQKIFEIAGGDVVDDYSGGLLDGANSKDMEKTFEKFLDEQNKQGNAYESAGYNFLQDFDIDELWDDIRNLVYLLYIVLMIVIGFMIMFRAKLPGQLIVSVGNSIPGIIVGVILVTFSFTIAGYMLDFGKILITISEKFFASKMNGEIVKVTGLADMTDRALKAVNDGVGVESVIKPFMGGAEQYTGSFFSNMFSSVSGLGGSFAKISSLLIGNALATGFLKVDIAAGGAGLALPVELAVDPTVESGIKLPILIFLLRECLILLVCVYASFKLFITMLTTYIRFFVNVILAPIKIFLGSFPGNFSVTINCFKELFANVLVFVGISVVLNFTLWFTIKISTGGKLLNLNFFGNTGLLWPEFVISLGGVILLGGYIFASNMPSIINGFLKVGANKDVMAAGEATKKSLSKIPFVGGMFN